MLAQACIVSRLAKPVREGTENPPRFQPGECQEVYEPQDMTLPAMVVLRYRPRNPDAASLFFGD